MRQLVLSLVALAGAVSAYPFASLVSTTGLSTVNPHLFECHCTCCSRVTADLASPTAALAHPTVDLARLTVDLERLTADLAYPTADLERLTAALARLTAALARPTADMVDLEWLTAALARLTVDLAHPTADLAGPSVGLALPTADLARPMVEIVVTKLHKVGTNKQSPDWEFQQDRKVRRNSVFGNDCHNRIYQRTHSIVVLS
ncbi:hypothetical protein FJT64_026314 [Amphibalanus amphitrite]|uniref:Uncharacterized protein n=1 Tax=Amphibalanus amphitrite TaxID=1232801 RepID=A0A6A4W221_AMPAM|nr:hypothetical protein FJT64_026314 [Amphibalanus amphitrite]